ncbi:hypothetical protein [Xylella fastidiosa]|uniref:Uncharacterized protein n=1 Tax=Xylella fastidiosa subsp. fastidiosa TaxID=644356 RepID=A0AAJ5R1M9_XYLFS|nr:hypothetical protein [Xylella fastidiosa]WCF27543.1 hypothetical protein OK117_07755 [Xylella fastidiosa subsp. fastidiosa]
MGEITIAASDLCTLNERSSAGDSDVLRRLALVIQFIKDAVRILDQEGVPDHVHIRVRVGDDSLPVLYGYIVTMIDTVISYTLKVSSPKLVRDIQYKSVWTKLFYHSTFNGPAGQVVAFKLRRRLYNQIAGIRIDEMGCLRNFRGAKILRFCLNVLGLVVDQNNDTKHRRALHKAVLAWTKKHFVWLHSHHPRLAESCLGNHITYDAEHLRLAYTHPAKGPIGNVSYLALNPAPPPPEPVAASAVPNA